MKICLRTHRANRGFEGGAGEGKRRGACSIDPYQRGAGVAEMPRKAGERAAREPKRYRLELEVGLTRARLLIPELDLANPPAPATWTGPALIASHQQ